MKIENHYKRLKENLEVIDESIQKDLIERQSTLGFSISAAATHLVEIFLHKLNLIDTGFILKHEWFKSKHKLEEKINFDFPQKEEILTLMRFIQEKRNELCYGTPKKEEEILEYVEKFNRLKEVLESLGVKNEE